MGKFIDLTGQKFGRLEVIERAENKGGQTMWRCRCECGKDHIVNGYFLTSGQSRSCGCYRNDLNIKHGMHGARLYEIWKGMKQRCSNPRHKSYQTYGARGITVCDEWNDFQAFYEWAISHGYSDNLEIERRDNTKGYSPDNCRWATRKEQMNNTRQNRNITYNNETHTIKQWAEIMGISYNTLYQRLARGWSIERALTE